MSFHTCTLVIFHNLLCKIASYDHSFLYRRQCLHVNTHRISLLISSSNARKAYERLQLWTPGLQEDKENLCWRLFWTVYLEPSTPPPSFRAAEGEQPGLCVEARLRWKCPTVRDGFKTAGQLNTRFFLIYICMCINSAYIRELGQSQWSLFMCSSINV